MSPWAVSLVSHLTILYRDISDDHTGEPVCPGHRVVVTCRVRALPESGPYATPLFMF